MDTDVYMKAPEGASQASIDGFLYEIPETGIVKVAAPSHVESLTRCGFVPHSHVVDGVEEKAELDIDEASEEELIKFILSKGGEADDSMSLKKLRTRARRFED